MEGGSFNNETGTRIISCATMPHNSRTNLHSRFSIVIGACLDLILYSKGHSPVSKKTRVSFVKHKRNMGFSEIEGVRICLYGEKIHS